MLTSARIWGLLCWLYIYYGALGAQSLPLLSQFNATGSRAGSLKLQSCLSIVPWSTCICAFLENSITELNSTALITHYIKSSRPGYCYARVLLMVVTVRQFKQAPRICVRAPVTRSSAAIPSASGSRIDRRGYIMRVLEQQLTAL